jgi:predicted amino acid-binding ACT domain protein
MAIKQLTVFIQNKRGTVASVTEMLSKNNVNLRALSIAETQDFGILRMVVNDNQTAEKVLNEISSNIKIPDFNTAVNIVEWVFINGQDAISCNYSLNNARSEISALLNLRDNIHIPAMFGRNNITPAILAYTGNTYGYVDEARNVAKEILYEISNEKWIYYFKNYFWDPNILIKLFYSAKTAGAWCELVREYIEDIEEDIPNEDIRQIIILSKKGDVEGVRKICKSLYLK